MRVAMLDPLTAEERDRLSARWPSAEAFYAERDDRTRRSVRDLDDFAAKPIEIVVDPIAARNETVQRMALVAANLTARWARNIRVVLPHDVPLTRCLQRDGVITLGARMHREMTLADPFGHWILASSGAGIGGADGSVPLRLFLGPWSEEARAVVDSAPDGDDYRVDAQYWTALGIRGDECAVPVSGAGLSPATVPAAGLAGALGAADLFKRAAGHPVTNWMPTFAWDTWTHIVTHGPNAGASVIERAVPDVIDLGRTLLAGVGAIGSAFAYLADLALVTGALTLFDRDRVDVTNLNRSPLFSVAHALDDQEKSHAVAAYLLGRGIACTPITGIWREHSATFAAEPFDAWVSLTNEDGAWAEVPFVLPPIVLHGTTTSGWGFGVGRHVPRREDCTLCRMPRPHAEFRGPCAEGVVRPATDDPTNSETPRASLPFLSVAAAALVLAERIKLDAGIEALALANDVAADLGVGLPAVLALSRGPTPGCRGCRASQSAAWAERASSGRYDRLSL